MTYLKKEVLKSMKSSSKKVGDLETKAKNMHKEIDELEKDHIKFVEEKKDFNLYYELLEESKKRFQKKFGHFKEENKEPLRKYLAKLETINAMW